MLRDIASGMVFLHSRKPPIVHGDLRSPNLVSPADGPGWCHMRARAVVLAVCLQVLKTPHTICPTHMKQP